MSHAEAYNYLADLGQEFEFDGFDHFDPEVVIDALLTNWDRLPEEV